MKGYLFFFITIFSIGNLASQSNLGIKIGYNLTKPDFGKNDTALLPSSLISYEEFKAFHLGIIGNFNLIDKFDLNADFLFIGKGLNSGQANMNVILRNTLAFPITIRYELLPKFNVLAGIEMNYILSHFTVNGLEFRNVTNRLPSEDLPRNFDAGLVFGLQYRFAKKWEIDFRYVRILLENSPNFSSRIYRRTFMVSLNRYFGNNSLKSN